jgi:hypothetical protein
MFPKPDEAISAGLTKGEEEVFQTYQLLIDCERRRLQKLVDQVPASPRRTWLDQQLQTVATWAAALRAAPPKDRAKRVQDIAAVFEGVQKSHDRVGVAVAENRFLAEAINLVRSQIAQPLGNPDSPDRDNVVEVFKRLFGISAAAAQERFTEILARLEGFQKKADAGQRGFVRDDQLPDGMGALAVGNGPNAYVKVSADALDGSMTSPALAATLVHEGSHTLAVDPTIDYLYNVYPEGVYYLREVAALRNAASYEQVVHELLSGRNTFPETSAIRAMRLDRQPATGAMQALLASCISRAWVTVANLKGRDHRTVDAPERLAAYLPELPQGQKYGALVNAYLEALYDVMTRLMRIRDRLVIRTSKDDDADRLVIAEEGTAVVATLSKRWLREETSTHALTRTLLTALVEEMKPAVPANPISLAAFVADIDKVDSNGALLRAYYDTYA